MTDWTSAGNI